MEQKPKWIAQSQTFIGLAVTAIGVIATSFGWSWWGVVSPDITPIVNHLFEAVGLVWAAVGRIRAQGPATILPPKV